MIGFFTRHGDTLIAEEITRSPWSRHHLTGPALCGLLARELETHCPAGAVPVRLTVDLFRAVLDRPLAVRGDVVEAGKRATVADAAIVQDDQVRARATALFLATGTPPPGRSRKPADEFPVPPPGAVAPGRAPLFRSGDRDWSHDNADHQNDGRKICWMAVLPLVAGEPTSPFECAAMAADLTNQVCHWGSRGVGYINADVTLTLSRLPSGGELGLRGENAVASAGISIGTATLYDREGALGTCVVTALSNAERQVDLTAGDR